METDDVLVDPSIDPGLPPAPTGHPPSALDAALGPHATALHLASKTPRVIERNAIACLTCRQAKVRCDIVHQPADSPTCTRCRRLNRDCTIAPKAAPRGRHSKAKGTPDQSGDFDSSLRLPGQSPNGSATSPIASLPSSSNPLGLLADASQTAMRQWRPRPFYGGVGADAHMHEQTEQNHSPHASTSRLTLPSDAPLTGLRVSRLALANGLDLIASGAEQRATVAMVPGSDGYFSDRSYGAMRRDVGPEVDPIDLGLVDPNQLPHLFAFFFAQIHPLAPILDADLYTPEYVRPRSALLLVAIALVAAQAMPGEAQLATRLHHHAERLRQLTFTRGLCSLELMQGLNILACWPRSARRAEDDRSGSWLSFAIAMTLELGIDRDLELKRRTRPPPPREPGLELPPHLQARYARARERAYIAVFIWERSLALATGRSWTFSDMTARLSTIPMSISLNDSGQITAIFDGWERDMHAATGDALLVDMVTLRCMMSDIRTAVLRIQADDTLENGSAIPKLILDFVADRIDPWKPRINGGGQTTGASLPYRQEASLLLVQGQTRLWTLALGLPHAGPGAPGVALLSACWQAAIKSCEGIVLHAEAMRHLPASISVMLVYSALLALTLHPPERENLPRAALLGLIAQVSRFLSDSGAQPSHREGPNAIFGHHLLLVLRSEAAKPDAPPATTRPASRAMSPTNGVSGDTNNSFEAMFEAAPYMPWPPAFAAAAGLGLDGVSTDGVTSWPHFDWLSGDAAAQTWFGVPEGSGAAGGHEMPSFLAGAGGM